MVGSVGLWKVYFEDGWASGKNWNIDEDDNKLWTLYLRPSVLLKTPAIKISVRLVLLLGFHISLAYVKPEPNQKRCF